MSMKFFGRKCRYSSFNNSNFNFFNCRGNIPIYFFYILILLIILVCVLWLRIRCALVAHWLRIQPRLRSGIPPNYR